MNTERTIFAILFIIIIFCQLVLLARAWDNAVATRSKPEPRTLLPDYHYSFECSEVPHELSEVRSRNSCVRFTF